jgi:hypothetical protein
VAGMFRSTAVTTNPPWPYQGYVFAAQPLKRTRRQDLAEITEQSGASNLTPVAHLRADSAVLVHPGVALTFPSAGLTSDPARF